MPDDPRKGAKRQTYETGKGAGKPSARLPHGKKKGWNDRKGKDKPAEVNDHAS